MNRFPGLADAAAGPSSGPRLAAALVVCVAIAAYLPATSGGFFTDDIAYVAGNQRLQSIPLADSWRLFTERTNPYEFLPLRDLSYRFDMALFGLETPGYHLHNLLLYALCCVAVWVCTGAILRQLGGGGVEESAAACSHRMWTCAMVTILFAVHPAHVESVAWISGRKELLSGLFSLLAIWQFARGIEATRPSWRNLVAAYAFFALALASKSTALPLVGVVFLLAAASHGRAATTPVATTPVAATPAAARPAAARPAPAAPAVATPAAAIPAAAVRRVALAVTPMVGIAAAWMWLTLAVGSDTSIRLDPMQAAVESIGDRLWASAEILGTLVKIAAAPVGLRLIYDVHAPGLPSLLAGGLGVVALLAGGWGVLAAWRRGSLIGFGVATFLMLCAPFLQLVPFATWSPASERFLFLPLLGLALAVATILSTWNPAWRLFAVAILAVVGIALTFSQARKWAATDVLIADAARLSPRVYTAQRQLIGSVLLPAGLYDDALTAAARVREPAGRYGLQKYVRARRAYDAGDLGAARAEASGLEPSGVMSGASEFLLLGDLAEAAGDDVGAIRYYADAERMGRTAEELSRAHASLARARGRHAGRLAEMKRQVEANPGDIVAQGNLANLELELLLVDDAIAGYRRILALAPGHPVARYNLGLSYARSGRHADAAAEIAQAIADGMTGAAAWNNLGLARERAGERDAAAAAAYRQAVQLDPAYCFAWINLGRLYVAIHDPQRARQALDVARATCGEELNELIDVYLDIAASGEM